MPDKGDFDADRTIQLDQIDPKEIELPSQRDVSKRVTPPPLPPEASIVSKPPAEASAPMRPSAPPEKKTGRNIALAVVFVLLLVGVIVLGLKMGDLVHGNPPATASASATATASAAPSITQVASAPAASSAAPVQTITINPIEMR